MTLTHNEKLICDLIAAARNAAETLTSDGREQDREIDSKALLAACEPFITMAQNDTQNTEIAEHIREIFGIEKS